MSADKVDACPQPAQVYEELKRHGPHISAICVELGVRRLELFGSAIQSAAPRDLDFLVDLGTRGPAAYAEAFFQLKERLTNLLGRPIDIVTVASLNNPYLRASVNDAKIVVYSAT